MFRKLFSRRDPPLTGAPAVRRLKTYSAESGYVFHYCYEGNRACRSGGEKATEYVFSITSDRRAWQRTRVVIGSGAIEQWEALHRRELSSTERYAVAKMALFQAFDERTDPNSLRDDIRVRNADVAAIAEKLGL